MNVLVPFIRGQNNDARGWKLLPNLDRRLYPAHPRHSQIHYHDVRFELAILSDSGLAISGLTHRYDVVLCRDDSRDSLPHNRVVIHAQNADWLRLLHGLTDLLYLATE